MDPEIILFDTDTYIDYMRQNPDVMGYVSVIGEASVFVNTIVYAELLYKSVSKAELAKLETRLSGLSIININSEIADIFTETFKQYILSHRPAIPDMMIAATCLYYDIPLFTFNKKDFAYITGLRLIEHDIKPMPRKGGSWFF